MTQLAKKGKKEVADKAHVECEAAQQTMKQTSGTKQGSNKGTRSPSPQTEEEIEQHVVNPQEMSARIKRPRELEKGGSMKK